MIPEPEWVPDVLAAAVNTIVALLVAGDYEGLEAITYGSDLNAGQLRAIVEDYPGDLVRPPRGSLDKLSRERVAGQEHMTFDVTCPLSTRDDHRPPLVLRARCIEDIPRTFGTRILGLRPEE